MRKDDAASYKAFPSGTSDSANATSQLIRISISPLYAMYPQVSQSLVGNNAWLNMDYSNEVQSLSTRALG
jgi:hypothetical protein